MGHLNELADNFQLSFSPLFPEVVKKEKDFLGRRQDQTQLACFFQLRLPLPIINLFDFPHLGTALQILYNILMS